MVAGIGATAKTAGGYYHENEKRQRQQFENYYGPPEIALFSPTLRIRIPMQSTFIFDLYRQK